MKGAAPATLGPGAKMIAGGGGAKMIAGHGTSFQDVLLK